MRAATNFIKGLRTDSHRHTWQRGTKRSQDGSGIIFSCFICMDKTHGDKPVMIAYDMRRGV